MSPLPRRLATVASTALFALVSQAAIAGPFSANYIFGDSLSDQGNLAEAVGHNFADPPYYHDSFTNGPTAVSVLSTGLGLSSNASLFVTGFTDVNKLGLPAGGTNYAVAGATSGNRVVAPGPAVEGVPGANLPQQVFAFLHSGASDLSTALFTVFIGGNDVRTAAHQGDQGFVTDGVASELASIAGLIAAGAKHFLVVNVPDVGLIPEFTQESPPGQAALAHDDSVLYDTLLSTGTASLQNFNPGVDLKLFDFYDANNAFIADAAQFGITDTTDPCYTNTAAGYLNQNAPATTTAGCGPIDPATGQAANIGQYLYWDHIHPTAKAQGALGAELLAAEIPEPSSLALALAGLGCVLLSRRRLSLGVTA